MRAEEQRRAESAAILDAVSHGAHRADSPESLVPPANALLLTGTEPVPEQPVVPNAQDPQQVLATLQAVTARQNERDMAHDAADLRQLMRAALQANSDVEMIRILQVGRDEMPEAIKTLQRALEAEVERESVAAEEEVEAETVVMTATVKTDTGEAATLTRSATIASASSQHTSSSGSGSGSGRSRRSTAPSSHPPRDTLDREFIETGIDALRRLSGAEVAVPLPSWTITRYEVDREEKIGLGFWSDVYKGTWAGRTVAIKVLAETTPRRLFVHEVSVGFGLGLGCGVRGRAEPDGGGYRYLRSLRRSASVPSGRVCICAATCADRVVGPIQTRGARSEL